MDYRGRQARLRKILPGHRLDALLITHLPNIRYLCGFSGSAAALLLRWGRTVLFTDGRYTQQAREEVEGAKVVISRKALLPAVAEWVAEASDSNGREVLGIEGGHMTIASRRVLANALRGRQRLRESPPLVEQARMIKDVEEVSRIRKAVALGASLFGQALETIRPGVREVEVAGEMEWAARRGGAEAMSFETIVAGGQRSALPHGRASQAPIPSRGFVVCDFGVILHGYCSDRTRTVWVGTASAEARRVYGAVLEAQLAAIAATRAGVSVAAVDAAARKVLGKSRLARFFTHSTGHGVGLEIHEAPRLARGQEQVLQAGMVVTIEPGVYLPGKWGVRIEDVVVVTERGCEVLSPTEKDFTAI